MDENHNLTIGSHTFIGAPLYFSLFILYYSIDERRRQYFPDKQEGKLQDDFDLVRFFLLM